MDLGTELHLHAGAFHTDRYADIDRYKNPYWCALYKTPEGRSRRRLHRIATLRGIQCDRLSLVSVSNSV